MKTTSKKMAAPKKMALLPTIDKSSPTPLYVQLENYIMAKIARGDIPPSKQIETEGEICKKFNISRMTTRKAFTNLVAKGVLHSIPGKGTFIRDAGPDVSASSSVNLGIFINDIALANKDFFSDILHGIAQEVDIDAHNLVIIPFAEDAAGVNTIPGCWELIERKSLGAALVLSEEMNDNVLAALAKRNFPFVTVHRYTPVPQMPCVHIDYEAALAGAVDHLVAIGHSRLAYLMGAPMTADLEQSKLRGFKRGLKRHHLFYDESLLLNERVVNTTRIAELMASPTPPTAIIAANDILARDTIISLQELGLRVPADVSVLGCNDLEAVSAFSPAITTLRIPRVEMGRAALRCLLKLLGGDAAESVYLEAPLLRRESCAPPPARPRPLR